MTQNELDKKGSEIIKTLARPYGSGSNRMDCRRQQPCIHGQENDHGRTGKHIRI